MAATSRYAYLCVDSKIRRHLEVDRQFKLGAIPLKAGL